jgi:hypothetical protein
MPLALSDNQLDLVMRAFAGLDPARPPASCAFAAAAMSAMPTWSARSRPHASMRAALAELDEGNVY